MCGSKTESFNKVSFQFHLSFKFCLPLFLTNHHETKSIKIIKKEKLKIEQVKKLNNACYNTLLIQQQLIQDQAVIKQQNVGQVVHKIKGLLPWQLSCHGN